MLRLDRAPLTDQGEGGRLLRLQPVRGVCVGGGGAHRAAMVSVTRWAGDRGPGWCPAAPPAREAPTGPGPGPGGVARGDSHEPSICVTPGESSAEVGMDVLSAMAPWGRVLRWTWTRQLCDCENGRDRPACPPAGSVSLRSHGLVPAQGPG